MMKLTLFNPILLMAQILCGSGLRLMEAVRLRVQDLDFDNRQLSVRDGKGNKDRSTLYPEPLHAPLRRHLEEVRAMFEQDMANGAAGVYLPNAIADSILFLGNKFLKIRAQ